MSRARRWWPATAVFAVAVVIVLVTPPKAFPPSAPVLAALVAAAMLGVAETIGVSIVTVVVGLALARYASGFRGQELVYRAVFATGVAALAIALAVVRQRQLALIAAHSARAARHRFGTALVSAHTEQDVARIAVAHASELGASFAQCAVRADGDFFRYLSDTGEARRGPPSPDSFSADDRDLVAITIRAGKPRYWSTRAELGAQADSPRWDPGALGIEALAIVPLLGTHAPVGAYVLGYPGPQDFDPAQRTEIEMWAAQLSIVLERAHLADFQRSVAAELQRSLLGPPRFVGGVGTTSRYLPAVSDLSVGGDWHDTMQLPGGRIGIAVGDVVGHGLSAATVMGQLRAALGACAIRSENAAEAVDALDAFASGLPGAESTTVAFAIVDPAAQTVDYCSAGHPPPLHIDADGNAVFLGAAQSWPLVVDMHRPRPHTRTHLAPGSLLLQYSDGLIERRGETLDAGLDRLRRAAVARYLLPLNQLCDELIDEMLHGSERRDDVVLLALRTPVCSPLLFLRKERAVAEALSPVRADLREWLTRAGVEPSQATDMLIAAGEACMNAVQHAYSDSGRALFRVEGARIGNDIIVTVSDTGVWKQRSAAAAGGRGLGLMRGLIPSVDIARRDGGTSVTLQLPMETENASARA